MKIWGAIFLLAVFFFVCGCSSPSTSQPEKVDAQKVKSLFLSHSLRDTERCAMEVQKADGNVLYKNERGLLMTDLPPEKLKALGCVGMSVGNEKEKVNRRAPNKPKPGAKRTNIESLLKLLPAEEMGARSFIKAHPDYDGRGIILAVLDTGVELDHPMLKKTSAGKDKIIDFEDVSGEGKIALEAVSISSSDFFTATDGNQYAIAGVSGEDYHFGVFKGTQIVLENDFDKFKDYAVLTYFRNDRWWGRVDTNSDKNFENDEEISNYAETRKFIRLGDKKALTAALNIRDDGKSATLCFDDGSHGTHVAGIAAGYDPNGLSGVAPGVQVIAVKIGDNRLAGGSTTTASKMLAIDYAVKQGAKIINISYGIRAGSNLGQSAIDRYVDRVAKEADVLFSISAGNEGPGIQTIGTPAGANLAISPGAYLSKETAQKNYGYLGVTQDNMWSFSSVGPRTDGGWKPSLAAPGSALSSLPLWAGGHENYRGTSMAAPEVSGALALLLSAAHAEGLPTERALVTRAVYSGASFIPGLKWIQQGYGLMNVQGAFAALQKLKGQLPVDYQFSINSPTSPTGRGSGIFVRSAIPPTNSFTVGVKADFHPKASASDMNLFLKTFSLEASAKWITLPSTFWLNTASRTFQVALDYGALQKPGLYSEKIIARDEHTGEIAFEIPVTVVRPTLLNESNGHSLSSQTKVNPGDTHRFFVNLPAGTTAVSIQMETDGPRIIGQLLDPEGRTIGDIADSGTAMPQSPVAYRTNIGRAGVYELDFSAPPTNLTPVSVSYKIKAYSLEMRKGAQTGTDTFALEIQNNFETVKLKPSVIFDHVKKHSTLEFKQSSDVFPLFWSETDAQLFSGMNLTFTTDKVFYDQMTDFPYSVVCLSKPREGEVLSTGALDLLTTVALNDVCKGDLALNLQGAFTSVSPTHWYTELTETRVLSHPISVSSGLPLLLEPGQAVSFTVSTKDLGPELIADAQNCLTIALQDSQGNTVQEMSHCE